MSDESDFRIRPGRIRSTRAQRARPFIAQALAAAQRAGGSVSRKGTIGPGHRSRFGRGQRASVQANRLITSRSRGAVVKARVVRHAGRGAPLATHLNYLRREGVTQDGEKARLFGPGADDADPKAFAERCEDDRHHFRFIVSPDDAIEMTDLKTFARDLVGQMEKDLGTKLDWVTAGFRARHGRVLLFDPTNANSSAYNPLLEVRRGEWEVRDVQNIADILVDPEGSLEKRNHWEKTSHSLLVGAILHVLYAEADKTLAGVAAFLSDPKRPIESTLAAMMKTAHLGEAGPHPVIASAARELLNKSDNERSGVLSTAMSFLGLYRDPVVAEVTRRCDWRITDIVGGPQPSTLYLVVPPSDIARTKPLIRLILNQIGRRLTEDLNAKGRRHRLLLMLDEFPALGRLDFFESALAFMAGYGLKSFLIAQSLNQIEKAYGPNNSILDNCHVRVSFATNDERTAKRVSDALGTATEMRAMRNYAGHRLSPWLGHLMVSRSETARPLLTPGEVMQLPPADEIVMVAGTPPIRAKKARYFEDRRFQERVLPPPVLARPAAENPDDWSVLPLPSRPQLDAAAQQDGTGDDDSTGSERRQQPELTAVKPVERKAPTDNEFDLDGPDDADDDAARARRLNQVMQGVARQVSLDPNDGMDL